jgi:hypothetical protein
MLANPAAISVAKSETRQEQVGRWLALSRSLGRDQAR